MKSMFKFHLICCGGLLLLILLGANAVLILGWLDNNWLIFLLGLVLIAVGIYYAWRYRYLKRRSHSDGSPSPVQDRKGQNEWWGR